MINFLKKSKLNLNIVAKFVSIKDKKIVKNNLRYKSSYFSKKFLANIFDLQFLISVLQEGPLCLKYVLFIGFVVSPMYNIFNTYKEKNIIML